MRRRLQIETTDGRRFCAKNEICPKRASASNRVWLANEVVYYAFARRAGLPVPYAAILDLRGQAIWGSELLEAATELGRQRSLRNVITEHSDSLAQLTKALLLDLALLNSDREPSAMLLEPDGRLWFVDHDKSLWGDGMERINQTPCAGDLERINLANLPAATENFVGDYLHCGSANAIVWSQDTQTVGAAFDSLPLSTDVFQEGCADIPAGWMPQDSVRRMQEFLPAWWDTLHRFLAQPNSQWHIQDILLRRNRWAP